MNILLNFVVLALASLVAIKCQTHNLAFTENGHNYQEKISVDKKNNIVIYDVPHHEGRPHVTYMEDFKNRLTVLRNNDAQTCSVWKMAKDEPMPDSVLKGMVKNNYKFPMSRYIVETDNIISTGKFDAAGYPHIAKFCDSLPMEQVERFETKDELEKAFLKSVVSSRNQNGIQKRQTVQIDATKQWKLCKPKSSMSNLDRCVNHEDKLNVACSFKLVGKVPCSWKVSCSKWKDTARNKLWWVCKTGRHVYTTRYCCDLSCSI